MSEEKYSVEYLGGHPLFMKKSGGELRVSDTEISFWSGIAKNKKWVVPLKDIKQVAIQDQDKITLTRALLLGFASLIFKKKKRFLVLYFNVAGMDAGAIFDFPHDIGDSRKAAMMQTIIQRKSLLTASVSQPSQESAIIRERETIREIVKIRCTHCGRLYDEIDNYCPYCGAGR